MGEIAPVTKPFELIPSSFKEAVEFAQYLAKSELVPQAYRGKPENILVATQRGREIGLPYLQSLDAIAVINGRPSLWGDSALAVVMAHPGFDGIEESITGDGDKIVAKCTVKRKGMAPVVREFSVADAVKAGLWQKTGPWTQYPKRMLQMRARGFAIRDAFPDALRGIALAEEVQDIEIEVNPAPVRPSVSMPQAASAAAEPAQVREVIDTSTGEVTKEPERSRQETTPVVPSEPLEGVPTLSEGQLKIVRAKAHAAGLDDAAVAHQFGVDRIEAIPATSVNKVLDFIKKNGGQ